MALKILHIIPSYKPAYVYGGPMYSCSALCEALVKQEHDVTVLTTTANGTEELPVKPGEVQVVDGVKVIYCKRITKDHTHFSPQLLRYLWKHVRGFDAVHIHSWWNLVSVFSLLICAKRGVRPVFSPRGMLSTYTQDTNHSIVKKWIHRFVGKPYLSKTKFHATSGAESNEVAALFPGSSVTEIFNFVNIPVAASLSPASFNKPVRILFLSRIDRKKGIELLLQALQLVTFPFELNIVGPSEETYLASLQQLAAEYQLQHKVKWCGPVYENKFSLIRSHDLLALTSYNENFANIIIESLSVGTPVLITDMVGLSNYVEANNLGWVCGVDVQQIKASLEQAVSDTANRNDIRHRAPAVIARDFNAEVLVQHYIDLYKA
ncbi:XrtY-associated glycosyltransferase XYAG1 [Deminuibacter soli]|uniref:Glycosyltransferase n=1 Tax=Deminuibacter soli TaxID=2291815 RepID=A0A3E1NHP7_9BACT|nr:glycosyltransferase [Deminuibacter soli]RFM27391.1 glycosyltransferase [Deminuibacter soli]